MNINNFDILTALPPECSFLILSHLEAKDLGKCSRVSTLWQNLLSDDMLWKNCFPKIVFPQGFAVREYIYTHAVTTEQEILNRIHEFAHRVQFTQLGVFTCIFPFNLTYKVTVQIGYGNVYQNIQPEKLEESAFFIKEIHRKCDFNQKSSMENDCPIINPKTSLFNFIKPRYGVPKQEVTLNFYSHKK